MLEEDVSEIDKLIINFRNKHGFIVIGLLEQIIARERREYESAKCVPDEGIPIGFFDKNIK